MMLGQPFCECFDRVQMGLNRPGRSLRSLPADRLTPSATGSVAGGGKCDSNPLSRLDFGNAPRDKIKDKPLKPLHCFRRDPDL